MCPENVIACSIGPKIEQGLSELNLELFIKWLKYNKTYPCSIRMILKLIYGKMCNDKKNPLCIE